MGFISRILAASSQVSSIDPTAIAFDIFTEDSGELTFIALRGHEITPLKL